MSILDNENFDLAGGLPVEEVHRRAVSARKLLGKAQGALGFWLMEIDERKLYLEFCCSSTFHYAAVHLDLEGHTVAEYLRTGKALRELPGLAQAYGSGDISPSKAREVTRVATADTEEFWLEAARTRSAREIEKLVAFTPRGGLPPVKGRSDAGTMPGNDSREEGHRSDAPLQCSAPSGETGAVVTRLDAESPIPHHRPGRATVLSQAQTTDGSHLSHDEITSLAPPVKFHEKLIIELTGEEMAVIADALAKARKESGFTSRAELLTYMARAFLDGLPGSGEGASRPPYQIVLHHDPLAGITWTETPKGVVPVSPEVFEKGCCDAHLLDLTEGEERPTWEPITPAEVNARYCACKNGKKPGKRSGRLRPTIPPALRRKVLLRAGHRCERCGATQFLVIHHLRPLAAGGKTTIEVLIVLCWRCHDLVHEGKVNLPPSRQGIKGHAFGQEEKVNLVEEQGRKRARPPSSQRCPDP